MNEPITWGNLLVGEALYTIFLLVGFLIIFILLALATKWEEWQKKKPDWKNDWE